MPTFRKKTMAYRTYGTLITCLLGTVFSTTISAQILDEIIVTAQKHAQGVNQIGITVNAFSGEDLKNRGVSTSEDIALFTPGLTVNETAATGVPLYTIRGVGFQDYSTAASSTVGLYFDEISAPYSVMTRGLVFDVERVEVLKGPQGDLYGRNTTAGQINYISKKPTAETDIGLTIGYSSFETIDFGGHISGAITDKVNGRIAFKTVNSGKGWQKSLTRDDELGKKDVFAIRGLMDIELSPSANLLLNAHYVDDQSDNKANTAYDGRIVGLDEFSLPYASLAPFIGTGNAPWYSTNDNRAADWTNTYTDPNGVIYDIRPKRDNQLKGISAKLNWDINDNITLTSITGYDEFNRVEANDWDGSGANDSSNINTTDLKVFSQELRLSGETDKLVWIGGLYYSEDTINEFYNYFLSDSLFGNGSVVFGINPFQLSPILQLNTRYEQETNSKAIFGHAEYNLTERFRVTAGLRYTQEERSWAGCTFDAGEGSLSGFLNTLFGATLAPSACGTIDDDPNSPTYIFTMLPAGTPNNAFHIYEETIETNKLMGKFGLDYTLSDDVLLYATFSNGFKSGGFNGANSNTTRQLNSYEAEVLNAFEVGLKSTLLDGAMQINTAAFFYDYKNKQEQDIAVTFVGNISGLTNIPKTEIYGAEVDLQWVPAEGWMVNFGAAWLNTEVKEWQATSPNSAWPVIETYDASGISLAQAPKWQFNAAVEYGWDVANKWRLTIGGDANYKSSTSGGSQPSDATQSYTVANARIAIGDIDDKWRLQFWARNVFDEYYYPAAYTGGNGPYVRSVGMPRTIGVTLDYTFK